MNEAPAFHHSKLIAMKMLNHVSNILNFRSWVLGWIAISLWVLPGKASEFAMSGLIPVDLRCEYHVNPVGIDRDTPQLNWRLESWSAGNRGQVQQAFQILVASDLETLAQHRGDLWEYGLESMDMHVTYRGTRLKESERAYWKVRVVDGEGKYSDWSQVASWTFGIRSASEWQGEWVGFDAVEPVSAPWLVVQKDRTYLPVVQLRKSFQLDVVPTRAILYVTALGNVEPRMNGQKVSDEYFTPGWTDYQKRLYYRAYDVTKLLQNGENAVGALLADGWFRGNIGAFGQNRYGNKTRFRAELHLIDAKGRLTVIGTDHSWKATTGPIVEADMQAGESYDARLEQPGWDRPRFDDRHWQPVDVGSTVEPAHLQWHPAPPVKAIMEIPTVEVTEPEASVFVFDMGQNFAGIARLSVNEKEGTVVRLRFGEMLNPNGTVYTDNLRSARVIDTYVCKGGGVEVWQPSFTFHGFRYVQVEGLTSPPPASTITGIALSTANADTGAFTSSSRLLNQLWSNTRWGQRSNYLEVPTDCPQRDERLGWTGDAQVFVRTGAYNQDIAAFMRKWMQDIVDTQTEQGAFNDTAPVGYKGSAAGWADAGVIIPWTIWKMYGDRQILSDHYSAMKRYFAYLESQADEWIGPNRGYGDWLAIGGITEKDLISTAYMGHVANLMTEIAEVLGRPDDAVRFGEIFQNVRLAFQQRYLNEDGSVGEHRSQTAHLLALNFNLLDPKQETKAIQHLQHNLEARNWRLGVGFLGVNLLLPTLTEVGLNEGAYFTILGREFPSWGYSIDQGATTVWERWNSFTKARGFGNAEMNSFNHYAYGSSVEWLYHTVLGIRIIKPGFERILVSPQPGPGIVYAHGHYDSVRGRISSSWNVMNGKLTMEIGIPPNCTAEIRIPASDFELILESGRKVVSAEGLKLLRNEAEAVVFEVGSGQYLFEVPYQGPKLEVEPPVPGRSNAAEEEKGPDLPSSAENNLLGIDQKIGVLLDFAPSRAVLERFLPEAIANPEFYQARESTLLHLRDFAPEYFTTEKLEKISEEFSKIPVRIRSLNTRIGELLDDPETLQILKRFIPEAIENPEFEQARGSTFLQLHDFAPEYFTEDLLQSISDALEELGPRLDRERPEAEPSPETQPQNKDSTVTPSSGNSESKRFSLDSKIGTLLEHSASRAILEKYLATMIANPQFGMAKGLTLKQLQPYASDVLSEDLLKDIEAELATINPDDISQNQVQ